MKYWVIRDGHVVGWVIASDSEDAQAKAELKYPSTWQGQNKTFPRHPKRRRPEVANTVIAPA